MFMQTNDKIMYFISKCLVLFRTHMCKYCLYVRICPIILVPYCCYNSNRFRSVHSKQFRHLKSEMSHVSTDKRRNVKIMKSHGYKIFKLAPPVLPTRRMRKPALATDWLNPSSTLDVTSGCRHACCPTPRLYGRQGFLHGTIERP